MYPGTTGLTLAKLKALKLHYAFICVNRGESFVLHARHCTKLCRTSDRQLVRASRRLSRFTGR